MFSQLFGPYIDPINHLSYAFGSCDIQVEGGQLRSNKEVQNKISLHNNLRSLEERISAISRDTQKARTDFLKR